MRERIIGAIAVVVVAIVFIPWLIAQVHAPRTLARMSSPPVSGSAAVPSANPNLYDLPPLKPAGRAAAPMAPAASAARVSSATDTPAAGSVNKSFYDLPPLNPAKKASPAAPDETSPAHAAAAPRIPATPPAAGVAASGWAVQAASFSDRKSAAALASRLTQAGIPAFLAPHAVGGTLYYRVMAGPYPDATAARAAAARIAAVSGTSGIVRQLGAGG